MSKTNKQLPASGNPSKAVTRKVDLGDRVIRFKCSLQNTILDVLRARGWQEAVGDGDWDFYWCDVGWMKEYFDHYFLEEHMKLCHFRNHYELTRKNLMVKNLKRHRKLIEREQGKLEAQKYDFFPMTFELPTEYHMFVEEFKKNPGQVWIMKPVAKSQGKGIFLFRKLKDIVDWKKSPAGEYQPQQDANKEQPESYVVQRYVDDPYLIGGRKFDLRVYILVTSYVPLKAWLYREGFARLSNTRFSLDTIDDTYVHLTNVAVQKTAPDYDPEKGSKWSVRQMRQYLCAKHGKEAKSTSTSATKTLTRQNNTFLCTSMAQYVLFPFHTSEELYDMISCELIPHLVISINCGGFNEQEIITMTAANVDECFHLIDEIFIRSLLSVQKVMINDKHCFELYGYDILLDARLKPWLLEVNASPSLTASSKEDHELKCRLLDDVLNVVDLENRLTGREKCVGGFDLIWDDGPVHADSAFLESSSTLSSNQQLNSFLGCLNDRKKQLRQLYKTIQVSKKVAVTTAS